MLRPAIGTTMRLGVLEIGWDAVMTAPLRFEMLSRKPESFVRLLVVEINMAVTGTCSDINFPNKSDASFAEMVYLSIKSEFGEYYARFAAKAMGLEVTSELRSRAFVSVDSVSGQCDKACFGIH
jgi:hypothetical protein